MPPRKPRTPAAPPQPFRDMTPAQVDVVSSVQQAQAHGERHFVLWYGSVRSGKTVGAVMAMLTHTIANPDGGLYIIGVNTVRQGLSIIAPLAEHYAKELGVKTKVNRSASSPRITVGNAEWLIFNGGERGRDSAVQGLTADGLFLDELALLNQDFVMQAEARVSKPAGLRIYTSNKTSPYHWTTLAYYDRAMAGGINAKLVDSDITGNQFLAQDYVAERSAEYDGEYLARFIRNEFALDFPPIYEPHADLDAGTLTPGLSIVYGEGRDLVVIQCAETEYGICLTDVSADESCIADDALVNSGKAELARRLRRRQRRRVRTYKENSDSRMVDTLLHLFRDGSIKVNPACRELGRAFDEYHMARSKGGIINALESVSPRLMRRIGVKHHA